MLIWRLRKLLKLYEETRRGVPYCQAFFKIIIIYEKLQYLLGIIDFRVNCYFLYFSGNLLEILKVNVLIVALITKQFIFGKFLIKRKYFEQI